MLEKEDLQVAAAINMVSELRRDIQRKKDVSRCDKKNSKTILVYLLLFVAS